MKEASDIQVLRPEDKLIVKVKGKATPQELIMIKKSLDIFLTSKEVLLLDDGFDVYIVRGGAKITLKEAANATQKKDNSGDN